VEVEHPVGLIGHSDADVGLHALCDAIFGALGDGDIGQHFPPSEEQWAGAGSDRFLAFAAQKARDAQMQITHLDVTLICERPRIGPHRDAMAARIREIASVESVSVKATTTEQLGFTGRGEGIAAMATATLRGAGHV
jgi:2-C-methyl-D-erythritol 4-phosphate cytidylyltransferase/2-C-methyl-D-erythritol 2,4-cyclodiphosphate synthase